MADKRIADRDITRVNELGQTVVIVPKGQPIPDHLQEEAKRVDGPVEDKARRGAQRKTRG